MDTNTTRPACRPRIHGKHSGQGWVYRLTCRCRPGWSRTGPQEDMLEVATAHLVAVSHARGRAEVPAPPTVDAEHAAACFTCWLRALGVEVPIASAMLSAARAVGWGDALAAVRGLGLPLPLLMQFVPPPGPEAVGAIEKVTRQLLAVPPSADVALAMGH